MPIRVNLKEIFPSDPQEINVDKVNFNFNKLLELGIGTPGPLGLTGPQGPAGPIGLTGPQGSRGATWWVDAGDPNLHIFTGLIDGDLYLDTITFNAWQYDDITLVWTQIASISAIVNAYLTSISAGLSPFKRGIGVSTGTSSDKYVVFRDRGSDFAQYSADVSRGAINTSTNLVLLLNNFDEETLRTALSLPNLPLNFPNPNTIYDALLKIVVSHAASGSANVLGRYHAEYGSLYENSITGFTELSQLEHNLKVKFLKNDVSLTAYLPLTNTWINTAHYSLSSPDGLGAPPDQNGIFEFITPKYNIEGGLPAITDSIYVRFGPAESHVEIGIDFQHIVADGITISSSYPTSLNSTFGIAPNYISPSNTKLDTKHHIMIDANSLLNGVVLLNKGLHVEGDANIVDGLAVGVAYQALTAPVDGAIIAGHVGLGTSSPTALFDVFTNTADLEAGTQIIRISAHNTTMSTYLADISFNYIDLQSTNIFKGNIYFYNVTSGNSSSASNNNNTYDNNLYLSAFSLGQASSSGFHTDTINQALSGNSVHLGSGVTVVEGTTLSSRKIDLNATLGTAISHSVIFSNNISESANISGNLTGNNFTVYRGVAGKLQGNTIEFSSLVSNVGDIIGTNYWSEADTIGNQTGISTTITSLANVTGTSLGSATSISGTANFIGGSTTNINGIAATGIIGSLITIDTSAIVSSGFFGAVGSYIDVKPASVVGGLIGCVLDLSTGSSVTTQKKGLYINISSLNVGSLTYGIHINGNAIDKPDYGIHINRAVQGLRITGAATNYIEGTTTFHDPVIVDDTLDVNLTADIYGATTMHATADVYGATTMHTTADVTGATTMHATADVYGDTTMHANAEVDFNLTFKGNLLSDHANTYSSGGLYYINVYPADEPVLLSGRTYYVDTFTGTIDCNWTKVGSIVTVHGWFVPAVNGYNGFNVPVIATTGSAQNIRGVVNSHLGTQQGIIQMDTNPNRGAMLFAGGAGSLTSAYYYYSYSYVI